MSSSTSSFKRLPLALLLCFALLAFSELFARQVYQQELRTPSEDGMTHRRALRRASTESASLVITGNSRAMELRDTVLADALFGGVKGEVLNLGVGGGTPRTTLYALESADYGCLEKGGTLLMVLAPSDLNRSNEALNGTIQHYFGWKEAFVELLLAGRWDNLSYFVQNNTIQLLKHRQTFPQDALAYLRGAAPEAAAGVVEQDMGTEEKAPAFREARDAATPCLDAAVLSRSFDDLPDEVNTRRVRNELKSWKTRYCANYTVDTYQTRAFEEVVREAKRRGVRVVLFLPTLSEQLRETIGGEVVDTYLAVAKRLAEELDIAMLDYVSEAPVEPLVYADGSHFAERSKHVFTRILSRDLWELVKDSGCSAPASPAVP